jgi:hypothetical protein
MACGRGVSDRDFAAERVGLAREFDAAIDRLEAAIVACPDSLWRASMWPVPRSDPWVWPKEGVEPVRERTDESIQMYAAVGNIVYHCLWFLDFYQRTNPVGFVSPEFVRGGPMEMDWADDGAAPIVDSFFSKDVLLRYLDFGRRTVAERLTTATDAELAERCPAGHPWSGSSLLELLEVNLHHVREHGDQVRAFLVSAGVEFPE